MKLRQLARFLVTIGLGPCLAAQANDAATAPANGIKDHVLFVGSDFGVVLNGHEFPVVDGGNRTFIVKEGTRRRELPLRELKDIRIRRGLKLTNVTAAISDLDATLSSDAINAELAESTLTDMAMAMRADIARDESRRALSDADKERLYVGSATEQIAGHAISIANAEATQLQTTQSYIAQEAVRTQQFRFINQMIETNGSEVTNDGNEVEITPEVAGSVAGLSVTGQTPHQTTQPTTGKPSLVTTAIVDTGNGRSDRLDLNFRVSAVSAIDNAYAVVTTEYTIPNSDEVFRRVLTERIGRIDQSARRVNIYEVNYPEGFHLRTYVIGIYADGQEVATNLSTNQLRMTREEAYQYLMVDYLASHRGQSRPPAAVLMAPRNELNRDGRAPELSRPIYVCVDRDGHIVRLSADNMGRQEVSPAVRDALHRFRFIPALDKGVPVEGCAQLVVADFTQ